ncbi:putative heterokaryon incompatibility protein [Rosellinia necatrix]|uniref:Putative heterokaryon incompatibility protein n=1 Tax=Rosellinia necatrix TaxID=77044 RepID=A0A1W2TKN9_ROSNE|nr:putative heterokaryon incompatibility protein [Rosellinia necatrix]
MATKDGNTSSAIVPAQYQYKPIDPDAGQIRLITLQPGVGDSLLCVSFSNATLPFDAVEPARPDLDPLRKTLPAGWDVATTIGENILFVHQDGQKSSYEHPNDPDGKYREEDWVPRQQPRESCDFEALSYRWGPELPQHVLLVVPGEAPPILRHAPVYGSPPEPTWRVLKIRSNLLEALIALRHAEKPRTLWIDALCIDQLNLQERARHVAKMGMVYKYASRVIVWLGPAADDSDFALETLRLIGRQMEYVTPTKIAAPNSEHPEWIGRLPLTQRQAGALKAVLNRPWFQGLWIWQEIILGHKNAKVVCGDAVVSWHLLRRALILMRETIFSDAKMRDGLLPYPLLFLQYVTYQDTSSPQGMNRLIHGSALSCCSDPRDRIYGFLGLCDQRFAERLRPDYTLTPAEVFANFFLSHLEEYGNLEMIRYCTLNRRDLDAPSWIPDFCNIVARPTQFSLAAGNTRAEASLVKPGVLGVLGVQVTTVKELSEEELDDDQPTIDQAWRAIKAWRALAATCVPAADPSLPSAFFATLYHGFVADLGHRSQSILHSSSYEAEFQRFTTTTTTTSSDDDDDDDDEGVIVVGPSEDELAASVLVNNLLKQVRHHGFMTTADGHIGLAPLGTRPGDVVSALFGCTISMILRPCDGGGGDSEGEDRYKVVGPAFIPGLNDAQGVLGPVPAPWTVRICRPGDVWTFANPATGEETALDPRLGPLPSGWSMVGGDFRNDATGHVSRVDPRCEPDALRRLGAKLKVFHLV